jgi:hypothetical protein
MAGAMLGGPPGTNYATFSVLTALGTAESEGMSGSPWAGVSQALYALPASSKSRPGDRFRCASVLSNMWSLNAGLGKVLGRFYNPQSPWATTLAGNSLASFSDFGTDPSYPNGLSAYVNAPKGGLTALAIKGVGKLPTGKTALTLAQNSAGTWHVAGEFVKRVASTKAFKMVSAATGVLTAYDIGIYFGAFMKCGEVVK